MEDIGLDMTLMPSKRFVFTRDSFVIDDELELFADVRTERLIPSGNKSYICARAKKLSTMIQTRAKPDYQRKR
jgi:hypothetical protein